MGVWLGVVLLFSLVFRTDCGVVRFSLNNNNIGDEGASALAYALKVNTVLTWLK